MCMFLIMDQGKGDDKHNPAGISLKRETEKDVPFPSYARIEQEVLCMLLTPDPPPGTWHIMTLRRCRLKKSWKGEEHCAGSWEAWTVVLD